MPCNGVLLYVDLLAACKNVSEGEGIVKYGARHKASERLVATRVLGLATCVSCFRDEPAEDFVPLRASSRINATASCLLSVMGLSINSGTPLSR